MLFTNNDIKNNIKNIVDDIIRKNIITDEYIENINTIKRINFFSIFSTVLIDKAKLRNIKQEVIKELPSLELIVNNEIIELIIANRLLVLFDRYVNIGNKEELIKFIGFNSILRAFQSLRLFLISKVSSSIPELLCLHCDYELIISYVISEFIVRYLSKDDFKVEDIDNYISELTKKSFLTSKLEIITKLTDIPDICIGNDDKVFLDSDIDVLSSILNSIYKSAEKSRIKWYTLSIFDLLDTIHGELNATINPLKFMFFIIVGQENIYNQVLKYNLYDESFVTLSLYSNNDKIKKFKSEYPNIYEFVKAYVIKRPKSSIKYNYITDYHIDDITTRFVKYVNKKINMNSNELKSFSSKVEKYVVKLFTNYLYVNPITLKPVDVKSIDGFTHEFVKFTTSFTGITKK